MKVLIVEDNSINRELLDLMVVRLNHETVLAKNGKEAILVAKKEHPDLVLMDLRMPELDGFDATVALKKDSQTKDIPVIAVSANSSDEDIKKAIQSGCIKYIPKPVNMKELENVLSKYSAKK